ncbi:MAG: MFS transporter [Ktedonobacteraceae bacterium]|nr:MFS transporter [Ktedonobacteraceae bacterium]
MATQTSSPVHARRWLVLVVMMLAYFLVFLNSFLLDRAIAAIQRGLDASSFQGQAILSAYAVAFIVIMLTGVGERLGARYGRKRLFLRGLLVFMLFALLCSLAPSTVLLIIVRGVQGLAAGLMIPQAAALIQGNFLPYKTSISVGSGIVTAVLAVIAGSNLGGVLTTSNVFGLGWRAVFLVNIPMGLLVLVAVLLVIREPYVPGSH